MNVLGHLQTPLDGHQQAALKQVLVYSMAYVQKKSLLGFHNDNEYHYTVI